MLVTVSGLPGSGTSTVATGVAAELGLEHLDGGTVFRGLAAEHGMSLAAFGAYAEAHAGVDVELDTRLAARARKGDVVLESRLAGWIATLEGMSALRVWVDADQRERARRVARRDSISEADALGANRAREGSERRRYRAIYDIDLDDRSVYDLILDSTSSSPDELIEHIVAATP